MRYRNLSSAARSVVTARAAVTAGPGVSGQTRTGPITVSSAIGARIIAPPVDVFRSHQRAVAKAQHRKRLKSDQAVVVASLRSLQRKQPMAPIGDH